jgi:hypothetical protein
MPLLELKNVSSAYGSVEALRGVSLHVDKGEVVTLGQRRRQSTTAHHLRTDHAGGEIWFRQRTTRCAGADRPHGHPHVPEGSASFRADYEREYHAGPTARGHSKQKMATASSGDVRLFPDIRASRMRSADAIRCVSRCRGCARPHVLQAASLVSPSGPPRSSCSARHHPRDPRPRYDHSAGGANAHMAPSWRPEAHVLEAGNMGRRGHDISAAG